MDTSDKNKPMQTPTGGSTGSQVGNENPSRNQGKTSDVTYPSKGDKGGQSDATPKPAEDKGSSNAS